MTSPEYAIAYRPSPSRQDAPWVVQIVRADGANLTAARRPTEESARELVALLSNEARVSDDALTAQLAARCHHCDRQVTDSQIEDATDAGSHVPLCPECTDMLVWGARCGDCEQPIYASSTAAPRCTGLA